MAEQIRNKKELRGLALPALRERGGYFASKGKYDVAWGDVMVAVFTPIGGRPMNRGFGSALSRVLFEPSDEQLQTRVNYIVSEAISKWCPHVRLLGVRTLAKKRQVDITIIFGLLSDSQRVIGTVSFDRSDPLKSATTVRYAA